MNRTLVTVISAAIVPLCISATTAEPSAQQHIAAMTFLAGNWSGPMGGGTFHAYYTTPDGGKVISYSKLVKDGTVAFCEFEVFELDGDAVVLRPYPRGQPATPMKMAACKPSERQVIFENPDKDYPTRIVYHRSAEDRLAITLSDPHGGSAKTETFDLKRRP